MCRKLSVRCIVRAAICSPALSRSCNTSCADQRRLRCREAQKQALGSVATLKIKTVLFRNKVIQCHSRQLYCPQSVSLQLIKWSEWMKNPNSFHFIWILFAFNHRAERVFWSASEELTIAIWMLCLMSKAVGLHLVFIGREGPLNGVSTRTSERRERGGCEDYYLGRGLHW